MSVSQLSLANFGVDGLEEWTLTSVCFPKSRSDDRCRVPYFYNYLLSAIFSIFKNTVSVTFSNTIWITDLLSVCFGLCLLHLFPSGLIFLITHIEWLVRCCDFSSTIRSMRNLHREIWSADYSLCNKLFREQREAFRNIVCSQLRATHSADILNLSFALGY